MLSSCAVVLSDDRRKVPQFSENGMIYKALNDGKKRVIRYQIDSNAMSSDTKRCDNALEVVENDFVFFVELKGEDIKKAASQIHSTINHFATDLCGKILFGRIVCSRVPRPDIQSTQLVALKKKLAASGGNLLKGSRKIEEKI
ncbi:hypothetical protein HW932_00560 [Allochromatium humboldtianum]|uniref:Uncharacterized protein n=1 Tax=Allochromatium humboldtianum TaxID=504901 RepID=A0A850QZN7_9GAMM|nr:hypothetical protein [Allochromatium humboldtianum]NVZ07749.1 hypothetical protein [Allochromatium humboldtianum]